MRWWNWIKALFIKRTAINENANQDYRHEHNPMVDAAVEPTCTKPGLTEGSHCSVSSTFERMVEMSSDELATCRNNLLKYCGLDTLATMIYIIRHGQMQMNRHHVLQGRSDVALNDAGIHSILWRKLS